MPIAHQLEALLESAITSGLCPELRGCDPATGEVLPAQYLLLVRARPHTRAKLRQVAEALLTLLDAAEVAYADVNTDGCAKFRALNAAPDWLLRPSDPDDTDPFEDRKVEWQRAIRRCRTLMRFEEETEMNLAALIGISAATPRHEDRG